MIKSIVISFILFSGLIISPNLLFSQNRTVQQNPKDSVIKNSFEKEPLKSSTGAILRSLALPGWGQYYVESYWKAPIFVAGWGTCIFFAYDNNKKYKAAEKEYDAYTGTDIIQKSFLYKKREYFRDNRDMNFFYLAGVYLISAVDAYVGANLYEFNVDDNITLNYKISPIGSSEIGFTIKF